MGPFIASGIVRRTLGPELAANHSKLHQSETSSQSPRSVGAYVKRLKPESG